MTQSTLDQAPAPAASPENAGVSFIFEPIAPEVLSFAWEGTVVATISPPAVGSHCLTMPTDVSPSTA